MCLGDRAWGDVVTLRARVLVLNFRARMASACRSSWLLWAARAAFAGWEISTPIQSRASGGSPPGKTRTKDQNADWTRGHGAKMAPARWLLEGCYKLSKPTRAARIALSLCRTHYDRVRCEPPKAVRKFLSPRDAHTLLYGLPETKARALRLLVLNIRNSTSLRTLPARALMLYNATQDQVQCARPRSRTELLKSARTARGRCANVSRLLRA
jgi:hypothetical protein